MDVECLAALDTRVAHAESRGLAHREAHTMPFLVHVYGLVHTCRSSSVGCYLPQGWEAKGVGGGDGNS